VAVSAGNNQTAAFGRTLPIDPAVRVTDAYGNGVSGLEVVFEVTGGGGAALVRRPVTDADGVATVGAWTLGDAPGPNTLRATVTTSLTLAGNPVTFTATATAGSASALVVQAGNQQSATVGTAVATAPAVVVRDARGNGVPGVTVTFAPGAGSGTVTGATVVTGSTGVATVGGWTLGTAAGTQILTASAPGLAAATFTATATPGAVVRLAPQTDTVLTNVTVTSFVAPLPQIRAEDQYGNPVAGVTVLFTSIAGSSTLTGDTRVTGSDGLATLGSWRVSTSPGVHRIRITAQGATLTSPEPTFWVYAVGPAANVLVAPTSIQNQAATASAAVATVPVVRVVDANGFGVYGASVTFTVTTGTATVGAAPGAAAITVTTDSLGFASATAWTMGAGSGARTLTASVAGIAGTVVFTATVP
jgi:adhesin/invasin